MKVGTRVGAILFEDEELVVHYLGEGTYEGDVVPEAVGGLASMLHLDGVTNPCIKLDNGDTVYGCECWWGSLDEVKAHIGKRPVKMVRIADAREEIGRLK